MLSKLILFLLCTSVFAPPGRDDAWRGQSFLNLGAHGYAGCSVLRGGWGSSACGDVRLGGAGHSSIWALLPAPLLLPLAGFSGLHPEATATGMYTVRIQAVGKATAVVRTLSPEVKVLP